MRQIALVISLVLAFAPLCFGAAQTIEGYTMIPSPWKHTRDATCCRNLVIDAANEVAGLVFQACKSGEVALLGFQTGTITTGCDVDLRLETVDATGDPSGTLKDTTSNVTVTIADADDDVWKEGTLTATATVAQGDVMAIAVTNPGASFCNGQIDTTFTNRLVNADTIFPYTTLFTSTWGAVNASGAMIGYIEYDDGTSCDTGMIPTGSATQMAYHVDDTIDEHGAKFQLPWPVSVAGVWARFQLANDSTDFEVILYDDSDTELETKVFDGAHRADTSPLFIMYFDADQALSKDTIYRLAFRPTTTNDVRIIHYNAGGTDRMEALNLGTKWIHTERGCTTHPGTCDANWTDTNTEWPIFGLLINTFDDGAGGAAVTAVGAASGVH